MCISQRKIRETSKLLVLAFYWYLRLFVFRFSRLESCKVCMRLFYAILLFYLFQISNANTKYTRASEEDFIMTEKNFKIY